MKPPPYLENVPKDIQELILKGQKIHAIKLAREKWGLGLNEAKDAVEKIEREMNAKFPDQNLENVPQDIQELILKGQKIHAIKLAREKWGMGVKEAKEAVEKIEGGMSAKFPDQKVSTGGSGCLGILILFFLNRPPNFPF